METNIKCLLFSILFIHSQVKTADDLLKEREVLDRRRLEHAHLQYALLRVINFFSFELQDISFRDFNEALKNLAPSIHDAFTRHYAGTHDHS